MSESYLFSFAWLFWLSVCVPLQATQGEPAVASEPQLKLHCDKTELWTAEVAFLLLEIHNPTKKELFLPAGYWANPYDERFVVWLEDDQGRRPLPDSCCSHWIKEELGSKLPPGCSRFIELILGPGHEIPVEGALTVSVEMKWEAGVVAHDYLELVRCIENEEEYEEQLYPFDPVMGDFRSNPVRLEYRVPVDAKHRAVLQELQGECLAADGNNPGLWAATAAEFSLERQAMQERDRGDYRLSGEPWLRFRDEPDEWEAYGIDPRFESLEDLLLSVRNLDLRHREDDFLFQVAAAIAARRPAFAKAVWSYLAKGYPQRDHGVRARANEIHGSQSK